MKIYILRHEDRTIDCSFFAPLTKQGLLNSNKLITTLKKLNITKIISSPFIRTLQTILPFSLKKNIKIDIEYGLCEILHSDIIAPKSYNVELPDYLCNYFNYNSSYIPIIKSTDLLYPENDLMIKNRTKKIFREIIKQYHNTNENILIVTHQGICINILKIILKKEIKNYETGIISLIFENSNWKYLKIN